MRVSVFGLGYVGSVCSACFAAMGHTVVATDKTKEKVDALNRGACTIVEPGLPELIAEQVAAGRLRGGCEIAEVLADSELSLICVGTPGLQNGALDLSSVLSVCSEIGKGLSTLSQTHTVVVRSTVLPGTLRNLVVPTLERCSGLSVGHTLGAAVNPEFLREGSAIKDFRHPAKTVIGSLDNASAEKVAQLYDGLGGDIICVRPELAECIKYANNAWHALKVVFANEVGTLCKSIGVDSHELMQIFCSDYKLNISSAYLKPGFAFGGSCLPKDLRALTHFSRSKDLSLPVIEHVLASNRLQIERGAAWILSHGKRNISFLGFSFKENTDDLRESPFVLLIEQLLGKGCSIKIFDANVHLSRLMGANRDYLYRIVPHIASLMVSTADEATSFGDVIVVCTQAPEHKAALEHLQPHQILLELTRVEGVETRMGTWDGLHW